MHISYRNTSTKIMPQVYEPSEDTFLLAEAALSEIVSSERVLEVGCGSGVNFGNNKVKYRASILGIDINPFAVKCSRKMMWRL
jgi:release factor glutamine methyltransferase